MNTMQYEHNICILENLLFSFLSYYLFVDREDYVLSSLITTQLS